MIEHGSNPAAKEPTRLIVDAPEAEVWEALRQSLSDDELACVRIEPATAAPNPLMPEPMRAEPVTTVVLWFASAIVGGVVYDVSKKAATLLYARFGPSRVRNEGAA